MLADISKTDKLFAMMLFAFVVLIGANRLWETDTWWHLKTGQIISETQQLPARDVFSHTGANMRWTHDEWLGDVYLYGIFKKHGFPGVIIAAAIAGAFIFSFALGVCRLRGSSIPLSAALLCVAAVAARARITPRPDVFALMFFSADIYLLNKLLYSPPGDAKARSFSRLIPVIQILWVNFHPSGLIGIGLVLLSLISSAASFFLNKFRGGEYLSTSPKASHDAILQLGVILIATVAVSFINPYYLHSLTAPFEFSANKSYFAHIAEWAAIPRAELFSLSGDPQTTCFKILAVLGIIAIASSIRRVNLFDAALFAGTLFMAVTSRRFIAMFAIAAVPCVTFHLSFTLSSFKLSDRAKAASRAFAFLFIAALCFFQTTRDPRFTLGTGVKKYAFPESAVKFLKTNKIDGSMFNDYGIGGYLIWNLYPRNKVFIDGRTTFYGPDFYNNYIAFESSPSSHAWRELESKYGIDYAVLSVAQRTVRDAILLSSPAWRTVFWDSRSIILVKDSPRFSDIIKKYGYYVTEPYTVMNLPPQWEKLSPGVRAAAKAELERNVSQSGNSLLALRALTLIYFKDGDKKLALDAALRGLSINPGVASLHAIAGQIYLENGDRGKAIGQFSAAAGIDKNYEEILKRIRE